MEHLCFECKHSHIRKIGEFEETNCPHFPPVKQQVDGNVSGCEKFEPVSEGEE